MSTTGDDKSLEDVNKNVENTEVSPTPKKDKSSSKDKTKTPKDKDSKSKDHKTPKDKTKKDKESKDKDKDSQTPKPKEKKSKSSNELNVEKPAEEKPKEGEVESKPSREKVTRSKSKSESKTKKVKESKEGDDKEKSSKTKDDKGDDKPKDDKEKKGDKDKSKSKDTKEKSKESRKEKKDGEKKDKKDNGDHKKDDGEKKDKKDKKDHKKDDGEKKDDKKDHKKDDGEHKKDDVEHKKDDIGEKKDEDNNNDDKPTEDGDEEKSGGEEPERDWSTFIQQLEAQADADDDEEVATDDPYANMSFDEYKQAKIKEMLAEGWVIPDENASQQGPPRRPPPIPPKSTSVPGMFSKIEYDTSHMWSAVDEPAETLAEEAEEDEDKLDLSGTKVAEKYEVSKELGSGSTSTVLSAKNKESGEEVVVKVVLGSNKLLPSTWKNSPKLWQSCVENEHIVKLIESFEEESAIHLVLERLQGTATSVLKRSSLTWTQKDACRVITQILKAVDSVHQKGITHGDVTAGNILTVDDKLSSIKLGGFTKSFNGESDGDILCDLTYKAPEVLERKKHGQPADLWAVGCLSYLFLSGKLPFQDKNTLKLNLNIKKGAFDFPQSEWEKIDAKAKDFVKSLLDVDPTKRPTASDALKNEWIVSGGSEDVIPHLVDNLKATVSK
eukprot:TRINITY_DN1077_c0_g1_i2.p1 TRINITY_DN1077_c0_g1~~TRINITY_DN1077_c0_g1_i2.p1  ORF type:complete len:666 (+),score=277.69 TRINITY_DN1077_c0_g1_i2:72-2069(+)